MPYKLSKEERETIISFNEAESTAHVYACNTQVKNRLRKLSLKSSDIHLIKDDEVAQTYIIPKEILGFNLPRKLSEEEKKKRAIRLQQNVKRHKAQKNDESEVI